MDQLIPLFLKATAPQTQNSQICRWNPDPIPRAESPTLPLPSKSTSRPRRRPGPVTDLTIVPYTASEWLKVMEEVKTLYYKQQYRQCSARCKQILETIRDPYRVHPLYSIYLCFFAASSLELTARSLHNNSSLKLPLLQESLTYYRKAQSYMEFAAFATNPDIIHASSHKSHSSMSSSIRSSVESVFSETSNSSVASSILDSPTSTDTPELKRQNSTSSILKPAPLRTNKKRVSFLLTSEPTIPDSQNGGIMTAEDLLARFPSPPTHDTLSPTIIPQNYAALTTYNPPPSPTYPLPSPSPSHISARALARYKSHLTSLKSQLEYHAASTTAQIHTLSTIRRARRSNGPDLFSQSPSTSPTSPTTATQPTATLALGLGLTPETTSSSHTLTSRIQRLKQRNWLRPRFNAVRYQDLCDRAIAELDDGGWHH
ncbi:hypothetical protein GLAREA_00809 [Glarea lozoyensis ATCC 20868]|uniref:Uncharacterized protein n=1 Tax=Glarea lozoyensis (strain ATCC 20868 / MF5171) TaxID=1116229 RepID=S3CXI6_GLAL2|nr:uncharacterized protein GLAREA_00809 [Glarea lozoyensis ATCC 20868]EPE29649.1 hypothetical protein GLAREA_00809 [Glarea lozoyensis ATCC 20868]